MRRFFGSSIVRALAALGAIIVLGLIFNADGAFFKWSMHRDMLRHVSVYGILACGMTVVIISGGIDLAVGSVLGLCAVLFSILTIHWSWSPWQSLPVTIAAGTLCGLVSGGLIGRFRIQPFIATLAMMVFARHAGDRETLTLVGRSLLVERAVGARVERAAFSADWLTVEPAAGQNSLVELASQGHTMRVGRFLRPELRGEFARELRRAVRRAPEIQDEAALPPRAGEDEPETST